MGMLRAVSGLESRSSGLSAELSDGFRLHIDLLEDWLVRVAVVPLEGLGVDRTWMIAPDGETPWEGRDRLSVDGFACPAVSGGDGVVEGQSLRARVEADPLRICIDQKIDGHWIPLVHDRQNGAYQWFAKSGRLKHFQRLEPDAAHYGLGDKTGPLDRTGRRLRCLQSDALGYDAQTSDPLYKHAPWLIVSSAEVSCGLLYDTFAEIDFDLGAEHSNYFERFRHVETHEKGLVYYVLAGPQVRDVVPRLHQLTGFCALRPRWSLGFAFTTMHHADHPQAQQVITSFAAEARERGLPISAIHLGSGYTAGADGLRYVFNWNEQRFPDRKRFFADLAALGLRTCANIKPVLLTGHDDFSRATQNGWFVRRGDGQAAIEMFWGGLGASLDFTNRDTLAFWKNGVSQQVLGAGFSAVWNDNNECELWDETAWLDGFGQPMNAMEARPVHALLMTRASHEAMGQNAPDERPYTISRAGPIGIARYGETWSGDNRTSWHTLKWNLRQGLSMSLSGMPLTGHDIGGFDGPPPDAELLVRWFEMMALHPRCVMNSWKVHHDNTPNLPWMHEDGFAHVCAALRLRYTFLPLLYQIEHAAHFSGHPVIAPTFYWYDDPACRTDADSFMLGRHVLVAPVTAPDVDVVEVYLPANQRGWFCFHSGTYFTGGQTVSTAAALGTLPLFVENGAVLPLARQWDDHAPHDPSEIEFRIFSREESGQVETDFFWDNGLDTKLADGVSLQLRWQGTEYVLDGERPADTLTLTMARHNVHSR